MDRCPAHSRTVARTSTGSCPAGSRLRGAEGFRTPRFHQANLRHTAHASAGGAPSTRAMKKEERVALGPPLLFIQFLDPLPGQMQQRLVLRNRFLVRIP